MKKIKLMIITILIFITSNVYANQCSALGNILKDLQGVFAAAKILVPILVVVMSAYDFIKAITGKVDGEIKTAFTKFTKRLIFAVIFFFLPSILNFFLGLIDPTYSTCINS